MGNYDYRTKYGIASTGGLFTEIGNAIQRNIEANTPSYVEDFKAPSPSSEGTPASTVNPPPDPGTAATEAENKKKEDKESTEEVSPATSTVPPLRAFSDHTFVLMHMMNLINLRNEKFETGLERMGIDPKKCKHEKLDEDLRNTLYSLKGENPYPYYPTKDNPKSRNATLQCYGEPYSFFSYITAYPGYQNYLDIPTGHLSALAPKIRLFKVFASEGREETVEMVFPTEGISPGELEDLLRSGSKRGYGVGIKSFDIVYDGTDPETRKTSVGATLTLHASSMEELLKPRRGLGTGGQPLQYRYFDLAMKSDTTPADFTEPDSDGAFGNLDDLDFRLLAQVGVVENGYVSSVNDAYTSATISLGPALTHSYDLQQDGSVVLTMEYRGFIESEYSDSVQYDVFATRYSVMKDLYISMGSVFLGDLCGPELSKRFQNQMMLSEATHQVKEASNLIEMLRKRGKIYFVELEAEVFDAYNKAFNAYEETIRSTAEVLNTSEGNVSEAAQKADETGKATKKIIDKALETLQKSLTFQASGARKRKDNKKNLNEGADSLSQNEDASGTGILGSNKQEEDEEDALKLGSNECDPEEGMDLKVHRCAMNPNSTQVQYFYAGDLLNLILEQLSSIYSSESITEIIEEAFTHLTALPEFNDLVDGDLKNIPASTYAKLHRIMNTYKARAERFQKYRLVLGPTTIKDFFTSSQIMASIGDIPVPLMHFQAYLAKEIEGYGKTRIGLSSFASNFIEKYLRQMLMGVGVAGDQNIMGQSKVFRSSPIVGYGLNRTDEGDPPDKLSALRINYGGRKGLHYQSVPEDYRPLMDTYKDAASPESKLKAYEYQVFYDKGDTAILDYSNPTARNRFGIYTYQLGRDRGILKQAQFARTNTRYIKEAVMFAGKFNGLKQLIEVFDVNLETFADFQKFPGQKIHVDSKSLVPYLSKETIESLGDFTIDDFGIGGIYNILRVKHSIAPGKFDTSITAQWEAWVTNRKAASRDSHKKDSITGEQVVSAAATLTDSNNNYEWVNGSFRKKQEPDKSPEAPKCRSEAEFPDTKGQDEFLDEVIEKATSFFGTVTDFARGIGDKLVGYLKGTSDTAPDDAAPTAFDVGASFQADVQARRAGLNPDEGNQTAANNGATTTTMTGVAIASME